MFYQLLLLPVRLTMPFEPSTAGLWFALVASGLYHGLSPGMGWPLAVSAGLMERRSRAVGFALLPLAAGHMLAVLIILLPFSLLVTLIDWRPVIQTITSLLLIGFGLFLLVCRRHPRAIARIRPSQLGLWSFTVAIAHGAGLMLVPVYLGLCNVESRNAGLELVTLSTGDAGLAVLVSAIHTFTMILAGGSLAWLVYRYLGLKFLSRSWFNLDAVWASSLILAGAAALFLTSHSHS